nr:sensor domain-containing diguanylate cyclase [Roseiflexaceae bacterium]
GRPHYSSPADAVLRCPHLRDAAPHGAFCIPIFAQHDLIGLLQLGFEHAWESAEQQDRHFQIAITVAEQAGLALANLRLRETLRQQAIRDPLTGLFNRRAMEESLERELSRAIRRSMPLGIILFDLDHFKNYNDTFGHAAGDALLREVGAFLQRHVRGEDIACRYGGEEFVVILSEASLEQTHARAEMLRTGLHSLGDSLRRPHAGRTTASFGVAAYPDHAARSDLLLQQADAALYRAKAAGRDCVALADDASAYRFARQSCAGGA